jgi:hypothetical protein
VYGPGPSARRSATATALIAVLAVGAGAIPSWAQQEATFSGAILDPVGKGQPDFSLVLVDVATGQEYLSGKTSTSGEYALTVPVGAQYRVHAVIAPDGTRLAVQELPPIAVRVAGHNHLDVRFQMRPLPGGAAAAPATTEDEFRRAGVPWWKTPAGVTGIVVGAAAIAALALSGGGDDGAGTVSESAP